MHVKEIRDACYRCGHRVLKGVGLELRTDFCTQADQDCSKVKSCDPGMRIPVKHHPKPQLDDFVTPEEPAPDPDEEAPGEGDDSKEY